jgi:putative spermidine/putrescine transport system ATP-binding protein
LLKTFGRLPAIVPDGKRLARQLLASGAHRPRIDVIQMAAPAPSATMSAQPLTLDGITHSYGGGLAVDNVTLEVNGGELVALLGPSGCGKTTVLRMVAGLIEPTGNGKVLIDGRPIVTALPPTRKREIGLVFQNYALFPHMSVWRRTSPIGLRRPGVRERGAFRRSASRRCSPACSLAGWADRKPQAALGRAAAARGAGAGDLAMRPRILLLDEPCRGPRQEPRGSTRCRSRLKRLQRQVAHDRAVGHARPGRGDGDRPTASP